MKNIDTIHLVIIFGPFILASWSMYVFYSIRRKAIRKVATLNIVKRIANNDECEALYLKHKIHLKNTPVYDIVGQYGDVTLNVNGSTETRYFINGFDVIIPADGVHFINIEKKNHVEVVIHKGKAYALAINNNWSIENSTQGIRGAFFGRAGHNTHLNTTVHSIRPAHFNENLILNHKSNNSVSFFNMSVFLLSLGCMYVGNDTGVIYFGFIPLIFILIGVLIFTMQKTKPTMSPYGIRHLPHGENLITLASGVITGINIDEDEQQTIWFTSDAADDSQKLHIVNHHKIENLKVGQSIEFEYLDASLPSASKIINITGYFCAEKNYLEKPFIGSVGVNVMLLSLVPTAIIYSIYLLNAALTEESFSLAFYILYSVLIVTLLYPLSKVWKNYKALKSLQRESVAIE